ncbi:CDGSH iron-sulfur domain-containing protein [Glutamicibacter sp. PS]|uniref:CDGSH iron-sulfur domain-containing protein n=1 Tax=Glutamicibacter sp. PS TaxID=3075634 RepID=UPI002848617B|nr:CDGSH iron-sulfur domain-containing protein [Glutamicibacter sp. PS]MDR4534285.1 CDGSH iron-sulfur domain-containing protein [Glutamicibacter sp. PS]
MTSDGSKIVVCPQGPLIVRGEFTIEDGHGQEVPTNRTTVALCRCGSSAIKPFCDGTHKLKNFEKRS